MTATERLRARRDEILRDRARHGCSPAVGIGVALALMGLALAVPTTFGWQVNALHVAPLSARWDPRVGRGTGPAIVVALAAVIRAPGLSRSLRWSRLLAVSLVTGVVWSASLAMVDGTRGIGGVLGRSSEYLPTARHVGDLSAMLHGFIARIPLDSAGHWPTHVSGHPPGALLFFVLLVHLGLGSGLAAGWTVVVIAATTPLAVLITLRRLGAETAARDAAPFLVLAPAAIWSAVSADAVFAAVAAWGICLLAVAATDRQPARGLLCGLLAGVLLGYCAFLSYGLVLVALPAVVVVALAGSARVLAPAFVGAAAVFAAFTLGGFAWWDAYPVLRTRYYAGIASRRPASYWVWGDLAALCFSAGPVLGASVSRAMAGLGRVLTVRSIRTVPPAVALTLAASACILLADLSLMSKAEVERIWLPFVPWLLLGTALLPEGWRRRALALQLATALVVQSLLFSRW